MPDVQPKFQFRLRTLFILTTIVAVVLAVYALWDRATKQFFHDVLVGETGSVTSSDDWPGPLKSLTDGEDAIDIDESTIQVYCLCQGLDPEYVWRMDGSSDVFEQISDRWKLAEVANPNWHVLKGYSHNSGEPTPSWWSPKQDSTTKFYACPQTLGGLKGDRFQVALDKERGVVFVHYWFNF